MASSSQVRHAVLVVVSLAVHGLAFVLVSSVDAPPLLPDLVGGSESFEPIEVVRWDPSQRAGARPAAPPPEANAPAPRPTTDTPGPSAAETETTPRGSRSRDRRDRAAPTDPTPRPPAAVPAPSEAAPPSDRAGTRASPHALALSGLRDQATAGKVTLPSPRLSGSSAAALGASPGADEGIGGEPEGDRRRSDGKPRTLAEAGFARDRRGNYAYREPAGHFTAKLLPDGRVRFKDHIIKAAPGGLKIPDLYTLVRKGQKRELWSRDKQLLLERTFELRLAIAVAHAEAQIDRRLAALYRDLLDVWGAPDRDARSRRRTLFDRWDDCDERMRVALPGFEDAEVPRIDEVRKGAGTRARESIVAFVRKHLPAGSADAYPADELAELNRGRKSEQRFAPYASE